MTLLDVYGIAYGAVKSEKTLKTGIEELIYRGQLIPWGAAYKDPASRSLWALRKFGGSKLNPFFNAISAAPSARLITSGFPGRKEAALYVAAYAAMSFALTNDRAFRQLAQEYVRAADKITSDNVPLLSTAWTKEKLINQQIQQELSQGLSKWASLSKGTPFPLNQNPLKGIYRQFLEQTELSEIKFRSTQRKATASALDTAVRGAVKKGFESYTSDSGLTGGTKSGSSQARNLDQLYKSLASIQDLPWPTGWPRNSTNVPKVYPAVGDWINAMMMPPTTPKGATLLAACQAALLAKVQNQPTLFEYSKKIYREAGGKSTVINKKATHKLAQQYKTQLEQYAAASGIQLDRGIKQVFVDSQASMSEISDMAAIHIEGEGGGQAYCMTTMDSFRAPAGLRDWACDPGNRTQVLGTLLMGILAIAFLPQIMGAGTKTVVAMGRGAAAGGNPNRKTTRPSYLSKSQLKKLDNEELVLLYKDFIYSMGYDVFHRSPYLRQKKDLPFQRRLEKELDRRGLYGERMTIFRPTFQKGRLDSFGGDR